MFLYTGLALLGALFLIIGVATFVGKIGREPAGRWYSRKLTGAANTTFGIAFILYGALRHELWALTLSLASLGAAIALGVAILVRAVRSKNNDEIDTFWR